MNNDKKAFNDADVLADHNRLVRELDVLLNGEAGAAQQASLCDIVAQIRLMRDKEVDGQEQIEPVALRYKLKGPGAWHYSDFRAMSDSDIRLCDIERLYTRRVVMSALLAKPSQSDYLSSCTAVAPADPIIDVLKRCLSEGIQPTFSGGDLKHLIRLLEHPPLAGQHQGKPVSLRFPTMLRKMWSGGEVQQWVEEQGPLYHEAPISQGGDAALRKVYDLIGLNYSHDVSVLLANFQNMKRFSEYLHAIEREFFMVPGEPSDEPEDAGSKPDDECLVNCWGSTQEQYVEQFRNALAYLASKAEPAGAGAPE